MVLIRFAFTLLLPLIFGASQCSVAGSEGKVNGQVFVATAGGQSMKLGDVEIGLYTLSTIGQYIKSADDALAPRRALIDKAMKDASADGDEDAALDAGRYMHSAGIYFEQLPPAVTTTRTDADGRFSIAVQTTGDFALVARATRRTFDSAEIYHWIVGFSLNGKDELSLNLANENMTDGTSKMSLIHTLGSLSEISRSRGEEALAKVLGNAKKREAQASAVQAEYERAKAAVEAKNAQALAEYIRRNLPRLVSDSQMRAVTHHPEIARAGSAENTKFVAEFKRLQAEHSPTLDDPGWPEKLAGDTPVPVELPPGLALPDPSPAASATALQSTPAPSAVRGWIQPRPPYPAAARAARITGSTSVTYSTDASGNVASVTITKSAGNAILDHWSQTYIKQNWHGPPSSTNTTTFEYRLQ